MERQLIEDYERSIEACFAKLTQGNLATVVEFANVPEHIRGFGHVKRAHLDTVRERWKALENRLAGVSIDVIEPKQAA